MTSKTTTSAQPGLIYSPGPEGWWDSERVSSPQVRREPDGTWKMWYYGRDATFDRQIYLPTGRCGLARSVDGIQWERVRGPLAMGAIFEPSADSERFDSGHVGVSDVYYCDGLYWMWYFGGDRSIMEVGPYKAKGIQMRPGCALSRDGVNWVRLFGPYRGAFLDVGQPGDFDALFCAWPRVLRDDDGSWKMYYHSLNPATGFFVGLAISSDGFRWQKVGSILGPGEPGTFDERGIGCRHLLKLNGQYLMFYEGTNNSGYFCIGLATSEDGINWKKDKGEQLGGPVFCHAPQGSGRWDAGAVGTPCVVPMEDGSFRLYYVGVNQSGHDELSKMHQIGLAVSDGPNFRKWRRWGEQ